MPDDDQRLGLLDENTLERSSVVANSAMNRERQLTGVNSYARELGVNPLDLLTAQIRARGDSETVRWLDLCCGTGRALSQAADRLDRSAPGHRVRIIGVDLVDFFDPLPRPLPGLELICEGLATWSPAAPDGQPSRFDLITCVHGLHYIGDKLGVLARAASWLTEDGTLIADLDLASIRLPDGSPAGRPLATALRRSGVAYDARRKRITVTGARELRLPYRYLGADDRAGPNYTGQPAVHSYYVSA